MLGAQSPLRRLRYLAPRRARIPLTRPIAITAPCKPKTIRAAMLAGPPTPFQPQSGAQGTTAQPPSLAIGGPISMMRKAIRAGPNGSTPSILMTSRRPWRVGQRRCGPASLFMMSTGRGSAAANTSDFSWMASRFRDEDGAILCWIGAKTAIGDPELDYAEPRRNDPDFVGPNNLERRPDESRLGVNQAAIRRASSVPSDCIGVGANLGRRRDDLSPAAGAAPRLPPAFEPNSAGRKESPRDRVGGGRRRSL